MWVPKILSYIFPTAFLPSVNLPPAPAEWTYAWTWFYQMLMACDCVRLPVSLTHSPGQIVTHIQTWFLAWGFPKFSDFGCHSTCYWHILQTQSLEVLIYCGTGNFHVQEIFTNFRRFGKISCLRIFMKISCTRIAYGPKSQKNFLLRKCSVLQ